MARVDPDILRRTRREVERLASSGLDWTTFAARAGEALGRAIPFERMCWHPVDPGTTLFTGSFTENTTCSASWLAEHEYVLDDVNKWAFLARSGYRAGSLSQATHGDMTLSARYRSSESFGHPFGDELRGSFVTDGMYWGSAAFIREPGSRCFTDEEVRFLASLSSSLGEGFRRALVVSSAIVEEGADDAPGVVVFDARGDVESVSPAARRWLEELVEVPVAPRPEESRVLQVVAARARRPGEGLDARIRARTGSGRWLLLYGTPLTGADDERVAVIIRPASAQEVAPVVLAAFGLSERERQVTRLCMAGLPTKQIAGALAISQYTVQDHLKSIFDKTGTRSRGELVGLIFLEHYANRFDESGTMPVA